MRRKISRQRQRNIQKEMKRWQRTVAKLILPPVAAAGLLISASAYGLANPTQGTVTTGTGTISSSGATTTITQSSDKLAINWQSFNIAAGETVNFIQPDSAAIALNRVTGSDPSAIYGTLSANGQVFLINPNGILFSSTAQVNVGGMVSSTLNLSDNDFRAGNYLFKGSGNNGAVINQGTIRAGDGGYVALLGSLVSNEGIVTARQGIAALGAGNQIRLDFNGDGLIYLTVDQAALGALAQNKNLIQADGGTVLMTAKAADALAGTVVNNSGRILAKSISNVNGEIVLDGGTNGAVNVSGALDASGAAAGQTGGAVKVLGDQVILDNGAFINVAGNAGGGSVLVGGNYQGTGAEQRATTTRVAATATIAADALATGNGGQVVVWADDTTQFAGTISAQGGSLSGDGGKVETSGKRHLQYGGSVDLRAPRGQTGTLLLDPADFVIADEGGDMTPTALAEALGIANVTIKSSQGAAGTNGDVNVNDAVGTWANGNTLTLSAYRDVNVNAAITNTNGASVVLMADNTGSGTGTVNFSGGATISLGGTGAKTVDIYYNPTSYTAPTDYRAAVSGGALTAYMLVNQLGTASDAATVKSLGAISNNSALWTGNFALGGDLDASATSGWNSNTGFRPIGDSTVQFKGKFDGLGHTIDKLTIASPAGIYDIGLFGVADGAGIANLGLTDVNVSIMASSSLSIGALVGRSLSGTAITNCYSSGVVSGEGSATQNYVGGLVGYQSMYGGTTSKSPTIADSYSDTTVTVVLHNESTNSYSGGLVGYSQMGIITNSYSKGTVGGSVISGGSLTRLDGGGLVGNSDGDTIENSYSTANVDLNTPGACYIGGLAGYTGGTKFTQCFSTGAVNGYGFVRVFAGGLAGWCSSGAVDNSYSTGNVTAYGDSNYSAGGLIGYNSSSNPVAKSYSTGRVTVSGAGSILHYVGGLFGVNASTVTASYWDTTTSGQTSVVGKTYTGSSISATGLTTAQMKTATAFTGWSPSIWSFSSSDYPRFAWEASPFTITGILSSYLTNQPIYLIYDGSLVASGLTAAGGAFSVTFNANIVGSNTFLLYVGSATGSNEAGKLISVAGTNFDLTLGQLDVVNGSTAGLISAKGSLSDDSIPYTSSGSNVTLTDGIALFTEGPFAVGGNITTTHAGQTYNGAVTVSAAAALAALTAGNITFNGNVTASAALRVSAAGDIVIAGGKSLSSSVTTGAPLVLVAGEAFINHAGSGALTVASGGHWQVYSQAPADDTLNGLPYDYKQYNTSYGGAVLGTGNGLFYRYAPAALTATLTGTVAKAYDGALTATPDAEDFSVSGLMTGDSLANMAYTSAVYSDRNAGTTQTVTVSGLAPTFRDARGPVYGYTLAATGASGNGVINPKQLSLSPTAANKTYDGGTGATITNYGLSGFVGSETVSVTATGASFSDANAGDGKTVTLSGLSLRDGTDGGLASNYSLPSATATTTANIAPKALTLSVSVSDKVYDGNANATVSDYGLSGFIGPETVTAAATGVSFSDANAGDGKTVTLSGISLRDGTGGGLASNYRLPYTTTTATADISPRALTISGTTAASKTYDGSTTAVVTLGTLSGFVGGETVNISGTAGEFASKNAGGGQTVTVVYTLSDGTGGGLAGNYSLADTITTADISPRALSISGTTAASKTYDGSATAAVTLGTLSGFVGSETIRISGTEGTFASKNAGDGQTVTVVYTLSDGTGGGLAGNYSLADTTVTADIYQKALSLNVSVADKNFDGNPNATVTDYGLSGFVSGETVGATSTRAAFIDSNIGEGKLVRIDGISLRDGTGSALAGNYTVANTTTAIAAIRKSPQIEGAVTDASSNAMGTTGAKHPPLEADGSHIQTAGTAEGQAQNSDIVITASNASAIPDLAVGATEGLSLSVTGGFGLTMTNESVSVTLPDSNQATAMNSAVPVTEGSLFVANKDAQGVTTGINSYHVVSSGTSVTLTSATAAGSAPPQTDLIGEAVENVKTANFKLTKSDGASAEFNATYANEVLIIKPLNSVAVELKKDTEEARKVLAATGIATIQANCGVLANTIGVVYIYQH